MNYKVSIPSHKRPKKIIRKTLKMLKDGKVNRNKIYIFVNNKKEADEYKNNIDNNYYNKIIITNTKGVGKARNKIINYFKERDNILMLDDDIASITKLNNNKMTKVLDVDKFIKYGFKKCKELNGRIWGIYPVNNAYYIKNTKPITESLKFIIGSFTGLILDKKLKMSINIKEDYELTIKYYKKYNKIIRLNHYSMKIEHYSKGGVEELRTTSKINDDAANKLQKKYPKLIKTYYNKSKKSLEIKLNKI